MSVNLKKLLIKSNALAKSQALVRSSTLDKNDNYFIPNTFTPTPIVIPVITPSSTLTLSSTQTSTKSPTASLTPTPTSTSSRTTTTTSTLSPTATVTSTLTKTSTETLTRSLTSTTTLTRTSTETPTVGVTPTVTTTLSSTPTPTLSSSVTNTTTLTKTSTETLTRSLTSTATLTPTATTTLTSTATKTATITLTLTTTTTLTFTPLSVQCLGSNNTVQMSNPYTFNNVAYADNDLIGMGTGTYTFTGITSAHPIGFVTNSQYFTVVAGTEHGSKTVEGISVMHYTGTVTVDITGDFGTIGYHCYNHGYMGGQNRLVFNISNIVDSNGDRITTSSGDFISFNPCSVPFSTPTQTISQSVTTTKTKTTTSTPTKTLTSTTTKSATPTTTRSSTTTSTESASVTPTVTTTTTLTNTTTKTSTPTYTLTIFESSLDSDIDFTVVNKTGDSQYDDSEYVNIIQSAMDKWDRIILGVPKYPSWGMRADISLENLSPGVLGSAGITGYYGTLNYGDFFPGAGTISLSSSYLSTMKNNINNNFNLSELYYVVLHEVGHLLGITSLTLSENSTINGEPVTSYIDPVDGLTKYYYTGPNAFQAYKDYFQPYYDVSQFVGIPVEDDGGAGTANAHPEEGVSYASFNDREINGVFHPGIEHELMAGWSEGGAPSPLSKITIGFLEDMGYSVDYTQADQYDPMDPFFGDTPTVTVTLPTPTVTATKTNSLTPTATLTRTNTSTLTLTPTVTTTTTLTPTVTTTLTRTTTTTLTLTPTVTTTLSPTVTTTLTPITLNSSFSSVDDPDISLTIDNVGASNYEFQRSTVSDFSSSVTTLQSSTNTTYTDLNPSAGTYYYRVIATLGGSTITSNTETKTIALWDPSDGGAATWYDVSNSADTNKVTHSSGSISSVNNLGSLGSNYDISQVTAASQPLLQTNAINNLDVMEFNYHEVNGIPTKTISTSAGYSLWGAHSTNIVELSTFYVAKTLSLQKSQGLSMVAGGTKGSTGYLNSHLPWSNGQVFFDLNDNGPTTRSYSNAGLIAVNDIYIHNIQSSSSRSLRKHYHNGSDVTSSSNAVSQTLNFNSGGYTRLGQNSNFQIGEIVNYNTVVSDSLREQTEGYLAHKWGRTSDLPTGHTYKTNPPTVSS